MGNNHSLDTPPDTTQDLLENLSLDPHADKDGNKKSSEPTSLKDLGKIILYLIICRTTKIIKY